MYWFSVVRLVRWLFKLAKLAMQYSTKVATQMRLGAIIGEEDMFASQTYILKICSQQRCQKLARDVQRIRTWTWVPYGAIDVVIQIYRTGDDFRLWPLQRDPHSQRCLRRRKNKHKPGVHGVLMLLDVEIIEIMFVHFWSCLSISVSKLWWSFTLVRFVLYS